MSKGKPRTKSFKLEITGDESVKERIRSKLILVKDALTKRLKKPSNYAESLDTVLEAWLRTEGINSHGDMDCSHEQGPSAGPFNQTTQPDGPSTVVQSHFVAKKNTDQSIFLTCKDSLIKLVSVVQGHRKCCTQPLLLKKMTFSGHVAVIHLKCSRASGGSHSYSWASSPQLPTGAYLANERILHGLAFSGMRPSHYNRFVKGAAIGSIHKQKRRDFMKSYSAFVQEEYEESIEDALLEEQASNVLLVPEEEIKNTIDIKTDARHGHRRNAKDTSVVALGENTKKVLLHVHVTKEDDKVTQRHEVIGTKRTYDYLDSKELDVGVHVSDMNMGVRGFTKKEQPEVKHEEWHGEKGLKINLLSVSWGTKTTTWQNLACRTIGQG